MAMHPESCSVLSHGAEATCTPGPSSQTQPHRGCHISHRAGIDTQTPSKHSQAQADSYRVCPELMLGICMCQDGSQGLFQGFFFPTGVFLSKKQLQAKPLHMHVARKSLSRTGAATGSDHCHSCQGTSLVPCLSGSCTARALSRTVTAVTDPWCKPCGCAMSSRA